MSPSQGDDTRHHIAERAAGWLHTLQGEGATEAQRAEFVDWIRASPLHISEFLRISQLHRDLSAFSGWSRLSPVELPLSDDVVRLHAAQAVQRHHLGVLRGRRVALLAAGLAAVCVTGLMVFTRMGQVHYRTSVGERRQVTLVDGSVVDLAPGSDLVVRYTGAERLITLDHGDAKFTVAKNPNRPFIVQAAQTRVRAVGTVFDVDRGERGVSVTVVEGRVAVSQQAPGRLHREGVVALAPVLSLQANEQVSINSAGVMSGVHKIGDPQRVVTRSDDFVFDNERVSDVARRFNLRNGVQIEILDAQLATRRISGVFRESDPQSFVSFMQAAADVTVARPDELHIRLGSRGDDGRASVP